MPYSNPHPLYATWNQMRGRIKNPKNPAYHNYGGRGITVCERWESFASFVTDMSPKPEGGYTLDRIDNNGNYEPTNCRWATKKEQARNQNKTLYVVIEGKSHMLVELADKTGVHKRTILHRMRKLGLTSYDEITAIDHIKRKLPKGFQEAAWAKKREQTQCKRGHLYTPETTTFHADGRRECHLCRAETKATWRAKRKAAGLPYV